MTSCSVLLLGPPIVEGPEGPIRLGFVKAQALIFYLAAQPGAAFSRSHLAGLLWEEHDEAQALQNLSLTLHRLRRALPVWPVRAFRDALGWDAAAAVRVDTSLLLQAAARQGDTAALAGAVALRRGPFLHGFAVPDNFGYNEWVEQERQHWDRRVLDMLDRLAQANLGAGQWQEAVGHAQQGLAIDPLQERFHRHLMAAHYHAGERAAALAAYAACRQVLQAELGVEPDPATRGLCDAIVAGSIPSPDPGPGSVTAPSGRPGTGAATPPALPPLVGRERELAQLQSCLSAARAGQGRVTLLYGEAGIGKSRLLAEVIGAAPAGGTLLVGSCYETFSGLPFAPVVEALQQALTGCDLSRLQLGDLWLAEVARLVPRLLELRPGLPAPGRLDPGQELLRLFEGVSRFLAALPQPVLLVLEDLHWADASTLQLLAYLARTPLAPDLALLAATRSWESPATAMQLYAELEREGRLRRLDLAALPPAAVAALVNAITGREDRELAAQLFEHTQGNPLYAVEYLRCWQEGAAAADRSRPPMPASIQGVIEKRLSRLPSPARELVTAAAIFPQGTSFPLLHGITRLTEDEALAALEVAHQAGVLTEVATAPIITFGHDLVRRVVVNGLSQAKRQALHRRAFHQLGKLHAPAPEEKHYIFPTRGAVGPALELCEQMAYHAMTAGLWEEGAVWNQAAANAAERVFAYPAAARCLEQSLECLGHLPQTTERLTLAVDLRLRLGKLGNYFDPRRLGRWLAPVVGAATHLGDEGRVAAGLVAQAEMLTIRGRHQKAIVILDKVVPIACLSGNEGLLARVLAILGFAYGSRGESDRAIRLLEEAIPLFDITGDQARLASFARLILPLLLAVVGDFTRAIAQAQEILERYRLGGDPALISLALGNLGEILFARGAWREAVGFARAGVAEARKSDHQFDAYMSSYFLGIALARLGDLDGGMAVQQESIALARRAGTSIILDRAYIWLGEIHLMKGEIEPAQEAVDKGRRLARAHGYLFGRALADKVWGQIRAAAGRPHEARAYIQSAQADFQAIGARPNVARCHALLAVWAPTQAERSWHHGQAREMFQDMGMDWDLSQLLQITDMAFP